MRKNEKGFKLIKMFQIVCKHYKSFQQNLKKREHNDIFEKFQPKKV